MPQNCLHITKTDVLLWTLDGFKINNDPHNGNLYSEKIIREIRNYASKPKHHDFGKGRKVAEKLGISLESLTAQVSKVRAGHEPGYWKQVR